MSFKGTPMQDIYNGEGPWHYHTLPIVLSTYHSIQYQLKSSLECPPKPYAGHEIHHWDEGFVRMPFSSRNVFPSKDDNGDDILVSRWELVKSTLQQAISSSRELEAAINVYNNRLPKFHALHHLFEEEFDEEESRHFFNKLLPGIVKLALQLEEILPGSLPLLQADHCKSISLSQLQIASLLANAFLCTFSGRKVLEQSYPRINFIGLFTQNNVWVVEKLKCIIHYFKRVLDKMPCGVVTFERQHISRANQPRWDQLSQNLGNVRVHITSDGIIEEGLGLLQVDFANKFIGGGVLARGCVQEEIRFVINPELIVSRLFTERLNNGEALIMTGAERFSRYKGYGDTFKWDGNYVDETPFDDYNRRRTSIVAIDATRQTRSNEQFKSGMILRELNKAYAGFHSRATGQLAAVATGNWGCGAFGGNLHLKFIIQLMACSAARRDLVYFTFGSKKLRDDLYNFYSFIATNQIQISELWRLLCRFEAAQLKPDQLFSYIQQAYFDSKKDAFVKVSVSAFKTSSLFGQQNPPKEFRFTKTFNLNGQSTSRVSPTNPTNNNMEVEDSQEPTAPSSPHLPKRKRRTSDSASTSTTSPSTTTNLISIMNKIDGSPTKTVTSSESAHNTSWGFLNCVDEYTKQANKTSSDSNVSDQHHTTIEIEKNDEQHMEVEEIIENLTEDNEDNSAAVSSSTVSTPKKKITDYFKKT